MYKSVPSGIKKIWLDNNLYDVHKQGQQTSDFGMDNTPALLEGGFGLYSTANLKGEIGPVKTEYYRIALTRKGNAKFNIGLEEYSSVRNCILFGIPGQVFSLHHISNEFFAYYMLFSEEFISGSFAELNKKQQYPFLTYSGLQCFELDDNTAAETENIIMKMNEEIRQNKPCCSEAIRLYIRLILIHANRNYGTMVLQKHGTTGTMQNLYSSYLKLVGRHFLTVRKVADYAAMLHVSPDYLNRAIRNCSDKTARELIDEMIITEAKAHLLHSAMTVSEIAYKLEFSDPPHFNRFFRKHCRITPLEFRRQS
jgi:AraC family transcriptional regulator, transcriptional activator of pobA